MTPSNRVPAAAQKFLRCFPDGIGEFVALSYLEGEFPIGTHFSESLFAALKTLVNMPSGITAGERQKQRALAFAQWGGVSFLSAEKAIRGDTLNDNDEGFLKYLLDPEESDSVILPESKEELASQVVAALVKGPMTDDLAHFRGLEAMADGMKQELAQTPLIGSPKALMGRIQGDLTKERVLAAVKKQERGGVDENTFGFLQRWLQESEMNKVEDFVKAVTGASTITTGAKIEIRKKTTNNTRSGVYSVPVSHTCFSYLDLPTYPDYETFQRYIDIFLANTAAGEYQID